jgi:hypothetical protein
MRPLWVATAFLVFCAACPSGGGTQTNGQLPFVPDPPRGSLADDDLFVPTYGKAELQKALIAERGAEATGERVVAELEGKPLDQAGEDRLRVARADLAVRRRFITSLEACESSGRACPPRLDDPPFTWDPDPSGPKQPPPVDSDLRFDVASWQKLSAELFGRACACRTMYCVDGMTAAIDELESRPMPAVQGDELASLSITRARECLYRLRGKKATPGGPRLVAD